MGGGNFVLDNLAVFYVKGAVGFARDVEIMRNQHDSMTLVVELFENAYHLRAGFGIQVARGLVGEDDGGVVDQRPRDSHPLLLTAGKLVWTAVQPMRQTHRFQYFLSPLVAIRHFMTDVSKGQFDVVQHARTAQKIEALENETDFFVAQHRQLVVRECLGVTAAEMISAGSGTIQKSQNMHQGRLAAAGRPHDRHHFTRVQGESYTAEYRGRNVFQLVIFGEIFYVEKRIHCYCFRKVMIVSPSERPDKTSTMPLVPERPVVTSFLT